MQYVIICSEKILLFSKILGVDWSNKVCINELIGAFSCFLWATIVDFYTFNSLITITYKIIWLVDVVNIKFFEILSKKVQIQMP